APDRNDFLSVRYGLTVGFGALGPSRSLGGGTLAFLRSAVRSHRPSAAALDLAAVARLNDADLDAGLRCCRLQVSGDGLDILVLGVDQQSEAAGGGKQFTQQPKLFGGQLA